VVVGFAAETRDVENYARQKLIGKNLDWIVANDVSRPGVGMNSDDNAVVVLGRNGERCEFGPAPKTAVAGLILDQVMAGYPMNLDSAVGAESTRSRSRLRRADVPTAEFSMNPA